MNPCIEGAAEFCKRVGYTEKEFVDFLKTTYPVNEREINSAVSIYNKTKRLLNDTYLKTRDFKNSVYINHMGATVGNKDHNGIFIKNDSLWPWIEGYQPTEADWINIGWEVLKPR